MSLSHMAALSIWEVAHRWHNQDPNISTDDNIPLEVQDKIRLLTEAMYRHDLRSCNDKGIENWVHDDVVEFKDYSADLEGIDGEDAQDDEKYRQWNTHYEFGVKKHNEIIEDFRSIFANRRYSKATLDNVYVFQSTLFQYCKDNEIEPAAFWFDGTDYEITYQMRKKQDSADAVPDEATDIEPKKVKQSEINKAKIQAIAQTLWEINPEMTIVDISNHKATQIYGNGKHYANGRLREFISEVDPREKAAKTGRPRKKPPE